ncbi:MAG: hypothetical protein M1834_001644 [Cirrosporium novae-zelandiae]|nr:MAG: hypothetical protein M1834_004161 [Cirrosporium novae-zelandiae]KAI9735628.1 MAG: hypothetical protein M1834_001644 [Cirrosporium novae-zelandiae]
MIQKKALAFTIAKGQEDVIATYPEYRFDVLASPEDIIDTWGPGHHIIQSTDHGLELCPIVIGGGAIQAVNGQDGKFHWSQHVDYKNAFPTPFKPREKIVIGAQSISRDLEHVLTSLGAYTNPRLPWGLQVSLCTVVGRRVLLHELVMDLMPAFMDALNPEPLLWKTYKANILNAFRRNTLREWLGTQPPCCQILVIEIVREILGSIISTGIDKGKENFVIAWIYSREIICFKIPCENESYWARILADSECCATFAYITSKCLETDDVKCLGSNSGWHNTSPLLETAVCHHTQREKPSIPVIESVASTPVSEPWALKDKEAYFIGRSDSPLIVEVKRASDQEYPRLVASLSKIPLPFRLRMTVLRRLEELRERQSAKAYGENVVISMKKKW